jgi:pyridoxal phosphate enzyme (YggS family)
VDSLYIAQKLNASLGRKNLTQDILIQVNTTAEASKSGVSFANAEDMLWQIAALPCLRVKGLMTIGLMSIDPEKTRPYFAMLRELFERFGKLEIPGVEMRYLSMGMSDDYLVALEEGSNMLRLGSVLFGARDYGARQ